MVFFQDVEIQPSTGLAGGDEDHHCLLLWWDFSKTRTKLARLDKRTLPTVRGAAPNRQIIRTDTVSIWRSKRWAERRYRERAERAGKEKMASHHWNAYSVKLEIFPSWYNTKDCSIKISTWNGASAKSYQILLPSSFHFSHSSRNASL